MHQFHGMKVLLSCQNFHLFPPHSKHAALENDHCNALCILPFTNSVDGRDQAMGWTKKESWFSYDKIPCLRSVHSGSGAHLAPHSVGNGMAVSPVLQQAQCRDGYLPP